jgi:hypothetical protein
MMKELLTFTLAAALLAITANSVSLHAQNASPARPDPSIAVHLALSKNHSPAGESPRLLVTVKNLGEVKICLTTSLGIYRVHVEGKDGEPPMTEWNRHRHGDWRPGDGPDLMEGPVVCNDIAPPMEGYPGMSETLTFDLGMFYDLSVPGRYSVYMEIVDPASPPNGEVIWARTNTVQFEVEAKAQ